MYLWLDLIVLAVGIFLCVLGALNLSEARRLTKKAKHAIFAAHDLRSMVRTEVGVASTYYRDAAKRLEDVRKDLRERTETKEAEKRDGLE